MNNKGFTLVEAVATVAILGILFVTAIPAISNVTEKNKKRTYVNDANRMITTAKSIYKKDTTINEPSASNCVIFTMKDLKLNDLNNGPYRGEYLQEYSYVTINYNSSTEVYTYGVQLLEGVPETYRDKTKKRVGDIVRANGEIVHGNGDIIYKFYRGIKFNRYEENTGPELTSVSNIMNKSDVLSSSQGFKVISGYVPGCTTEPTCCYTNTCDTTTYNNQCNKRIRP